MKSLSKVKHTSFIKRKSQNPDCSKRWCQPLRSFFHHFVCCGLKVLQCQDHLHDISLHCSAIVLDFMVKPLIFVSTMTAWENTLNHKKIMWQAELFHSCKSELIDIKDKLHANYKIESISNRRRTEFFSCWKNCFMFERVTQ